MVERIHDREQPIGGHGRGRPGVGDGGGAAGQRTAAARFASWSPRSSEARSSIDWLDRGRLLLPSRAQLTSLAYDGLVGYRRVSGAAGATLVGALATDAPRAQLATA